MDKTLHILHLEEDERDFELVRRGLEKECPECAVTRVDTREAFLRHLENDDPDAVLADYSVPSFDGLAAIMLAREKRPGLPFIFVSGTIGEERAVEALKLGASDYVLKDRLTRLAPAIRRALETAHVYEESKKAEEELNESARLLQEGEQRFRRLVESVTDYLYTVTIQDGLPVTSMNGPGCVTVTGYTLDEFEADPILWYKMVYEDDRRAIEAQMEKILLRADLVPLEYRIRRKDGSIRWIKNTPVPRNNDQGELMSYDGLISDVTERKQLEDQLRQAVKMEAVGQLAGGVAHDFNNLLAAIVGYGHVLHMKMREADPLRMNVEFILESAEHAAHLTRSLLAFSRKQILNPANVDLNDIVRKSEKFLKRVIGEDIELRTAFRRETITVHADAVQLEQVVMNLATNARDAMLRGGSLVLETDAVRLDGSFVKAHGYGREGWYALLTVSDTGAGMDAETQKRIFEPFFTTKAVGKGTGLGLSMAYGIVKQHDGFINVYSEQDRGTSIRIYLPLVRAEGGKGRYAASPRACAVPRGTETLLLAEDDPALRKFTSEVLAENGYKVIQAANGAEAVTLFTENKDEIRLLILDMIMPKKSGKEAFEEILRIRADIKAIFVSGYSDDRVLSEDIPRGGEPSS